MLNASNPPESVEVRLERSAMSTTVVLVAYTDSTHSRQQVDEALNLAFAEVERLEALLSVWKRGSDVWRLNHAQGKPVEVSPETYEILERARWAGQVSDGAFDVTFHVLGDLWRFGGAAEKPPRVPQRREVEQRLRLIDFRKLRLDAKKRSVRLPGDMRVNLGGIAKGYVLERAAAVLASCGLASYMVQAGGDLLSAGRKPSGAAWKSGIQDPRGPRGAFFATLEFSDHAFSTAGDYARSYVVDGQRYHHILDPRTGYPARACRSVTVWATDALTADALDDAIFVLGPRRGLALAERTSKVEVVIVDNKNRVITSQRLADRLQMLRAPTDGP